MDKKIIFVINNIQNPRCIKRVNEFISKGYGVKVYAFDRGGTMYNETNSFPIDYVKGFSNDVPYAKRLPIIYRSSKEILDNNKGEKAIYYFFGLEIAMMFLLLHFRTSYIYEESDLMHTYISNPIIRRLFEIMDKWIIRNSIMTVFTSDGFRQYHYGNIQPDNTYVIPNKLPPDVKQYERIPKVKHDNLRIGFVGHIRYLPVKIFAETFCKYYPNNEFHFYGDIVSTKEEEMFAPLKKYPNCHFHGRYRTPLDLPTIYSTIDIVLSTYDTSFDNVRYAEPNKLYEAIFFRTPIIVSAGCFLGDKVEEMGVGYAVDGTNEEKIMKLLQSLTESSIEEKIKHIDSLDNDYAINYNDSFFSKLSEKMN
ncbi:MAG: capsular biosynthesis protein [Prevotella sp.]|nr:capsular biosynthesis protein [Prevotella sp.]